jgi:GT2 family glycosyltransferase
MTLTVVTVIHDSAQHLRALLTSLPDGLRVIVVDTGSTDDGATIATEAGAELVALQGNPGFGAANNAGVERAAGDVVALLNPDVIAGEGLLRLAERARDQDALHIPRLRNPDGSVQDSVHPLPGSARDLTRAITPGPLRRAIGERAPAWATAAALVARTETLRRLGPFDPGIFLFGEDLDLCLRARSAGVPTVLHRDVELVHAGGHSTGPEDVALRVRRHRVVVGARLGAGAQRRDDAIQILEHGLRAFRPRDRAYVREIRRDRRSPRSPAPADARR